MISMRKLFALLALLVALTLAACSGGDSESTTTTAPAATSISSAAPDGSQLTDEQKAQVEQIVRADPSVALVVGTRSYQVTKINRWSAGIAKDSGEDLFIGGIATVMLAVPTGLVEPQLPFARLRDFYGEWPQAERDKYLPYRSSIIRYKIQNLTKMEVSVDLTEGTVASIGVISDPQTGQQVNELRLQTEPTPQQIQGVPQEAVDVFNADERVISLLAEGPHQTSNGGSYVIAGVTLSAFEVRYEKSHDLERDWLLLFNVDQLTGVYETHIVHFVAEDINALSIVVDLGQMAIAWINPVRVAATPTPAATAAPTP
jgi:hypothetical protein